jgi:hypothetical protein
VVNAGFQRLGLREQQRDHLERIGDRRYRRDMDCGAGTYSPNANTLNADLHTIAAERTAGTVTLTLTAPWAMAPAM